MKKIILATLLMLLPLSSQALFEIRGGYGVNTVGEDDYGTTAIDNGTGLNVDFIFEPPLITDLGIGLRYEMMDYDLMDTGSAGEGEMDRLSLLINYRIIDFFAYFGVIGTFGLSTDLETNFGAGATSWDEKFNWSAGLEAGVNLGLFSVGAEVGKFFNEYELAGNPDLDLGGLYGKVIVGIGF